MRVKVLKIITFIAVIAFIMFATALDCGSVIPMIVCMISGAWLLLIAIANTPKGDHRGTRKNI